jgi:hypothetical protein
LLGPEIPRIRRVAGVPRGSWSSIGRNTIAERHHYTGSGIGNLGRNQRHFLTGNGN